MYIQNHKLKRKPVFMEESLDAEHRGIVYVTINTFSDIHDHQSLLFISFKSADCACSLDNILLYPVSHLN